MIVAAAYIRVSTDEQTELSPDSQIKLIQEYAKTHDMIVPPDLIYADEGISGRKAAKRPAFMQMIAAAKTKPKPFEAILVWKYSRFARNREDSIVYKSMLRKQCGIDVISISEQLADDKTSILIEALLEAMDEYYSINLAEEVKRGMREKVDRGGAVSAPAYGYDIDGGKYIVNELEAKWVRWIFDQFCAGVGPREIAINLNDNGVLNKRNNAWEARTVEYLLKNPVYIGKIRWNTNGRSGRDYNSDSVVITDGIHDPIISPDTYEAASDIFARRKKLYAKHAHKNAKHDYMLRGLLRCSNCMSTLVLSGRGLQCYSYAHGQCRESHYISLDTANSLTLDAIEALLSMDDFTIIKRQDTKPAAMQDDLDKEYAKLQRVKEAFEAGIDTLEEYKAAKLRITDNIKKIQVRLSSADTIDKKDYVKRTKKILKQLRGNDISDKEKNMLLRSFVDHIVFNRTESTFVVYLYG